MADSWIREGDTGPTLTSTVLDADDNRVDLTDAAVTLYMRAVRSTTVIFEAEPADVIQDDQDPTTFGDVEYVWEAAPARGGYYYFWRVEFDGGVLESFPNDRYLTLAVPADIVAEAS